MTFISILVMAAAFSYAGELSLRPESSIPTPAEKAEISRETPDLGAKESENWQKMRAERRKAREQILSDLRGRSSVEKQKFHQKDPKKREENTRFEGESQKSQSRERRPLPERPEPQNMYPPRGMPGPMSDWDRRHY